MTTERVLRKRHGQAVLDYVSEKLGEDVDPAAWVAESAGAMLPSTVCPGRLQRLYVRSGNVQRGIEGYVYCTACGDVLDVRQLR